MDFAILELLNVDFARRATITFTNFLGEFLRACTCKDFSLWTHKRKCAAKIGLSKKLRKRSVKLDPEQPLIKKEKSSRLLSFHCLRMKSYFNAVV